MKLKKAILEHIGRDDLKRICERLEIGDVDQRSVESMRSKLSRAHRATAEILFEPLDETAVKVVAQRIGAPTTGRRAALIEELLKQDGYAKDPQELTMGSSGVSDVERIADVQPLDRRGVRTRRPPGTEATEQYEHQQQAVQRPDVGVQDQFVTKKPPKTYRYDSSLDPTLSWDENKDRELAEWLLGLVVQAAVHGEMSVFESPQEWKGGGARVESTRAAVELLKRLTRPFLSWTGKAERHQISVPTVPLFVHERHSTKAILEGIRNRKAKGTNLDLFGDAMLDIGDKLDAYEHQGPWQNRMILGDSLQIMNSMLEFEGLGGQVQMIYIDPPYGVKFGSNFQPFVRKRDVKDGADADLTREPEMVKAYRDTWELGLHSYLTYLRDRLLLARELLHESGSCFVQISDTNVHHVREVMDDVFGSDSFEGQIVFLKTTTKGGRGLDSVCDLLLWYARNPNRAKYNPLYVSRNAEDDYNLRWIEWPDGKRERVKSSSEVLEAASKGGRVFRPNPITSTRPLGKNDLPSFLFEGKSYKPAGNHSFQTHGEGMKRLASSRRLIGQGNTLGYIRYLDDFAFKPISNVWDDVRQSGFSEEKRYVVQTSTKVIERCLLLTTDPGDLVFDATCGSGTTAYVAEQWGRRWITCDTSRVPLALARQRLLTATFPYYELKDPKRGPIGGFVYKRKQNKRGEEVGGLVPHITLKSIANDEPAVMEVLVDRPEQIGGVTRVSGPFVIEAAIAPTQALACPANESADTSEGSGSPSAHIDRMTQVLRQSKTLRLPENKTFVMEGIRRLSDAGYLHAEAIQPDGKQQIAIVFGPEDGAISSDVVYNAASEAFFLKYGQLYFFGFAIQAKARELLEDRKKLRIQCTYIAVTPDVAMSDLLKTSRSSEIFSVTGLPDFQVKALGKKNESGEPLYQATLEGLDIFDPSTMKHDQIQGEAVPAWMLDSDYDGMSFHATQVFFPKTSAWDNLQKSLKATFDASVWTHLAGTTSEPFALGEKRRVAVRVIDERGNELMRVREVE